MAPPFVLTPPATGGSAAGGSHGRSGGRGEQFRQDQFRRPSQRQLRRGLAYGHPQPFADHNDHKTDPGGRLFDRLRIAQHEAAQPALPPPGSAPAVAERAPVLGAPVLWLDRRALAQIGELAARALARPVPLILVEEAMRGGDVKRFAEFRLAVPEAHLAHFFVEQFDDGRRQRHLALRLAGSGLPDPAAVRMLAREFGFALPPGWFAGGSDAGEAWFGPFGGAAPHCHLVEPLDYAQAPPGEVDSDDIDAEESEEE